MHVSKLKKENEDMKSHYDQIIRKLTRDKEEAATLYSELKEQLKLMSLESRKWQQQAASFEKAMRDSTVDMKHGLRGQAENELIANLKRELALTQGKLVSLEKEFSMFKKHSKDQLEHERQLNSKLRHLAL
ncbi:PREDICTED: coiled-coil domain-containing protein 89-like [Amphimedon queenslandica]|uniref:Uncharacterized protein n=1 Tax=Amphimedon queenslandica TaxID=400682 RepID=A0A1X7VIP7_AMPQE|nr:PREDICTED: coiled-coil domain-containing protein 89-like [Amphimedon queenslandica]|eukprot:XP_019864516.1 PREDICTED: coiled-coil domain-containing protein 89-like [Amphimedon queenslandica]